MARSPLPALLLAAVTWMVPAAYAAGGSASPAWPSGPGPLPAVTLTINPDGTASWDGEPLAGVPDLEQKFAHQTQQDPKLQLDMRFHNVGQLSDSNRQTLLDVLEIAAKFGYVHVESTDNGARLTVLGPRAVAAAPK